MKHARHPDRQVLPEVDDPWIGPAGEVRRVARSLLVLAGSTEVNATAVATRWALPGYAAWLVVTRSNVLPVRSEVGLPETAEYAQVVGYRHEVEKPRWRRGPITVASATIAAEVQVGALAPGFPDQLQDPDTILRATESPPSVYFAVPEHGLMPVVPDDDAWSQATRLREYLCRARNELGLAAEVG